MNEKSCISSKRQGHECLPSLGTCLLSTEPRVWTCSRPVGFGGARVHSQGASPLPPFHSSNMIPIHISYSYTHEKKGDLPYILVPEQDKYDCKTLLKFGVLLASYLITDNENIFSTLTPCLQDGMMNTRTTRWTNSLNPKLLLLSCCTASSKLKNFIKWSLTLLNIQRWTWPPPWSHTNLVSNSFAAILHLKRGRHRILPLLHTTTILKGLAHEFKRPS